MKYQVAKMSIAQTAKVAAILYAVMGLVHFVIGVFIILFGKGPAIGVGILFIFMPVLAAIFGFIGVAIVCWIYNIIASKMGGIEFELTEKN